MAMKTHFFLMSTVVVLGATVLTTSYAATTSEYLHFTRHRDSQGDLLMAPTQPHSETSVVQKTMMPSQPKMLERRRTDWGMSAQDVKANEPVQPSWELQSPVLAEYEQRVTYQTQIEGIDAALTYTFYEGHLGQAKYVFEPQHDDAVDYVHDFYIAKKWIAQSYGLPTFVQDVWLDTLYQYDQSLWGQAVLRGHLVMVAEWKQPGTDIVLVLDGGENMIGLVADFASTTFVVPVSFDGGSVEASIEEGMEETTIQEALPVESMDDANQEDGAVQEALIEQTGLEGHPSDTEVVSNTSTELDEIEAMLNEEFPELEPLEPSQIEPSLEVEGAELPQDPQAALQGEELVPEATDPQAMEQEFSQVEEAIGDSTIEPGSFSQTSEPSISNVSENVAEGVEEMPLEHATSGDSVDNHFIVDHADEPALEIEAELEGHHL